MVVRRRVVDASRLYVREGGLAPRGWERCPRGVFTPFEKKRKDGKVPRAFVDSDSSKSIACMTR